MEENNIQQETTETNYLEVIKNLKENSVSKDEYNKVLAENKNLVENYINGSYSQEEESTGPQSRDPQEIRSELFNHEHNNLEYIQLALELRNSLITRGEPDPFLPQSSRYSPTLNDKDAAERCATVYKECVDYADGNSEIFTQELMRRTKDIKK